MLIIYYTDSAGKIVGHHGNGRGMTITKLKEAAEEYNKNSGKRTGRTANIAEVEEDSLTAYLFQKAAERAKWDMEDLQDALSSIEDALETVRGLIR